MRCVDLHRECNSTTRVSQDIFSISGHGWPHKGMRQPLYNTKTILFWNSYFGKEDYDFGLGHSMFAEYNCTVPYCRTTADRSEFPVADAVLFHMRDEDLLQHPERVPKRAHPKQIYIFYNFEAPIRTKVGLLNAFNDVFNLTMSYRHDADVAAPAWTPVKIEKTTESTGITLNDVRKKTRTAVWFISACRKAGSRRWDYAMELRKYIDIDIYGACGNFSCLKSQEMKCLRDAGRTHRFYFAFENAFCKDYRTEKTYRAWLGNMIPVVLGNYWATALPPKSWLDVSDFGTPRNLARKMKYLAKNDEEYLRYFDFRKTYKIITRVHDKGFCRLCEILHDTGYKYKSRFDVYQWWVEEGNCLGLHDVSVRLGLNAPLSYSGK